jgi:general secretion pathway protein G
VNSRVRGSGGFTLVEILLVVVIIGILAALVVPKFVGRSKEAQVAAAKAQIQSYFSVALDLFEMDNQGYPTTEQGLDALIKEPSTPPVPRKWKGPYLKRGVPKDPWGNDYVFVSPGTHNPDGYDVSSPGPDGVEGGGDDIANWEGEKE